MIVDKLGSVVYCNELVARIFRYDLKDMISQDVNNLVPSNMRDKHKELVAEFFKRDLKIQY